MGHKTLCEWRRHEIPADLKTLRKIVRKPKFVCGSVPAAPMTRITCASRCG